jgi:hypothetical protein
MSEDDVYRHLTEQLEAIRRHPSLYIGELNADAPSRLQCLLTGVLLGLRATGVGYVHHSAPIRQQAVTARGWIWNAGAPVLEMRERQFTPEQMVDELVQIELDVVYQVWKSIQAG